MTAEQVKNLLSNANDVEIKKLLLTGNLVVEPYDRTKAINKIAGLDGGCSSCEEKSSGKRVSVTYVNGSGESQDCLNCKK